MALRVAAFDAVTGDRIARVPGKFTWAQETNGYGEIKLTSGWTNESRLLRSWERTTEGRTSLAVLDGLDVVAFGPVTDRDPKNAGFTVNAAGSIWRALEDRLVMNPLLRDWARDGEVLIDEDNPDPAWVLTFTGSYPDIVGDLVALALAWGRLPIEVPARQGGTFVRTYNGWERHTVASRLQLLAGVIGGPEIRFRPFLRPDGGIMTRVEAAPELVDKVHRWNATLPAQRVQFISAPTDGALLATDVWGFGGKSDNRLLVTRSTSTALTDLGYPVMQRVVDGVSNVSETATLKGHTDERISRSLVSPEVYEFRVGREHKPRPGDHANVTYWHPAQDRNARGERPTKLALKILHVSGDASEWVTVKGRERHGV